MERESPGFRFAQSRLRELRPPRNAPPPPGVVPDERLFRMRPTILPAALALLACAGAAVAQPLVAAPVAAPPQWMTYADRAGTRVDYPSGIFSSTPACRRANGVALRSGDARARALPSMRRRTARAARRRATSAHISPARAPALDYRRIAKNFFVVSGVHEGENLLQPLQLRRRHRCIASYMTYPKSEEKAWDAIVTRMSLSLRPLR